jgi:trimeric autotransporter adhesin
MNRFLLALLLSVVLYFAGTGPPAMATTVYGLTVNNGLFFFDSGSPGAVSPILPITGLAAGDDLVGIDFRPANGQLYALGFNSTSEVARLYTVNTGTAAATAVGSGATLTGTGTATFFGFDFNPGVDRIRVVSSANTNHRLNPDTGALAVIDTMLAFAGGGGTPSVAALAYSNNVAGGTPTTLYGYNAGTNSLVTIGGIDGTPSPNGGQVFTVGPAGIFADPPRIGMDIFGASTAYMNASVPVGPALIDRFFSVNLATGAATLIGTFPFTGVEDIAVPEPSMAILIGLGLGGMALCRRRRGAA